jgi:hypothetical protein
LIGEKPSLPAGTPAREMTEWDFFVRDLAMEWKVLTSNPRVLAAGIVLLWAVIGWLIWRKWLRSFFLSKTE